MKKNITLYILLSIILLSLTNCSNEPKKLNACDCVKLLESTNIEDWDISKKNAKECNSLREDVYEFKILNYEKYDKLVFECTGKNVPVKIEGTYSNGRVTWVFDSQYATATSGPNDPEIIFSWSGTADNLTLESTVPRGFFEHPTISHKGLQMSGGFFKRQYLE
jgi:hypothetical protein